MRVDEFVTTEDFQWLEGAGGGEPKILPSGAYIKPLDAYYLPQHVKERLRNVLWPVIINPVAVYCRFGIVWVPARIIRKAYHS